MKAPLPPNENERLDALHRYEILDTESEPAFDDLCFLASHICGTPISLISLVDAHRQWFKSHYGVPTTETSRDVSFCAYALLQNDLMIVEDTQNDSRFTENPFVTNDPQIRFYAGAPLITPDGFAIGTICVMDRSPRHLIPEQKDALRAIARQVISQLELRRSLAEIVRANLKRERLEKVVRESEKRLFQFLEAVPVGIFVVDTAGSPYYANQEAKRILGKGIDPNATGEDLAEVYKVFLRGTPEEYPAERMPVVRALQGEVSNVNDMEIRRGDWVTPIEVQAAPIYDENNQVLYAIAAFTDMTHRKWYEARLTVQYSVTRVLAESASLAEATPRILQAICESVGWQVGAIWDIDRQENLLRIVDLWHMPETDVSDFETLTKKLAFPPGYGLPGRVWSSGKPAWIPDVVEDTNFPRLPAALKSGLHAGFGFPIMINDEVVGVLEFFSKQIHEPERDLLSMLGALGMQIGQFIERKRFEQKQALLIADLETAREELKKLKA